jgi:drug/metabolite transporter (DMT)-like permease
MPDKPASEPLLRADISLVLVTIIAAIGWVLSKYAMLEFAPFTFVALRFLLAGLVLAWIGRKQLRQLTRQQLLRSMATGMVMGSAMLVWIMGLQRTEHVGVGAFIISLNVVAVPLIGRLLFRQSIQPSLLLALVPALCGLAMISMDNGFALDSAQGLFIICMLGLALHLNLSSTYVRQVPPLALTSLQLLITGVLGAIAALLTETWNSELSGTAWLVLLCSALLATSLRFAVQNTALQQVSASHASMIFLVEPVWTALLSAWLLGERMSSNQILGCGLILLALLIYRVAGLRRLLRYFRG